MEHTTLNTFLIWGIWMARNFGIGTRDMVSAGRQLAQRYYAGRSYASAKAVGDRYSDFVAWARGEGIKKLEQVTRDTVMAYAAHLRASGLSASTAQNRLSAVNLVLEEGRGDQACRVTGREAGLESRTGIASSYRGGCDVSGATDKAQAIYQLAQTLGLRFEEASKLDLMRAERAVASSDKLRISAGTKGGQARIVPVTDAARHAIHRALEIARDQGTRNLIERDTSYRAHQKMMYRDGVKYHAGRHEYANRRYSELMAAHGIQTASPVLTPDRLPHRRWSAYLASKSGLTPRQARDIDRAVRIELSRELGHHREDVVSSYIGGQR